MKLTRIIIPLNMIDHIMIKNYEKAKGNQEVIAQECTMDSLGTIQQLKVTMISVLEKVYFLICLYTICAYFSKGRH